MPFVDRLKPLIDLREQVVSFPPQPVITEDNLVVAIDTVLYFTVNDPNSATYEIANPLQAIEQLTVTTLRNVIGGLTLEETLTSRDHINAQLRTVLDEATGKWGIRVNRVEIKSIDPPPDIQEAMEKQMRAERDRRAAILTAEGEKQSQILTAEGEKQAAVLTAEGARQAAILRAEGEAKAIETVFDAIHEGNPDPRAARATNTCRCCPSSRRATPTRCSSSRPSSRRRSAGSARRSRGALRVRSRSLRHGRPSHPRARGLNRPRPCSRGCENHSGPMFDSLAEKLQATLADVRRRGTLTEDDVNAAMREIRLALLEADVNFKVVRQFTARVKERCLGTDGTDGADGTDGTDGTDETDGTDRCAEPHRRRKLNPGQQVVKVAEAPHDGRRLGRTQLLPAAADRDPDGRAAGLGQDDGDRQARALSARGARRLGRGGGLRHLSPGGGRSAGEGRRPGRCGGL